jgi:uncharacterized protein (DUF983 family)
MSLLSGQERKRINAMAGSQVSLLTALGRGFRCKCPACGKGGLFARFLKVVPACPACGEEMHHHRADDFPAYLVILIVGHVIVPSQLLTEQFLEPPLWVHLAIWLPLTLVMTLGLLQPVKGAIVALQWHMGMHGFEDSKKTRAEISA